jgi:hypothetical protein
VVSGRNFKTGAHFSTIRADRPIPVDVRGFHGDQAPKTAGAIQRMFGSVALMVEFSC